MSIRVHVSVIHPELNRSVGRQWTLTLKEGSSIIDVIKAVDGEISRVTPIFPIKGYRSLLQMTFHPREERFYRQVAIQAYERPGVLLPVRQEPNMPLPNEVIVIVVPEGPCITEWEDVVA
ncbi:MAG: hypothetical protein QXI32_06310 [Candidatus Bathyarchaeia archaeon]